MLQFTRELKEQNAKLVFHIIILHDENDLKQKLRNSLNLLLIKRFHNLN